MSFCKKCNKEYTSKSCKVCKKISASKYRKKHAEKIRLEKKQYNQENAKILKIKKHERYLINSAEIIKKTGEWAKNNKDKRRIIANNWASRNREKVRLNTAKWASENKESRKINQQNRRSSQKNNGGKLSVGIDKKLFDLQKGKCTCCGLPLGNDYHLDHIMPLSLGGKNEDWNIQLLRASCNLSKGAKHPVEFMRLRGFLI